jgi:tRNA A-37 threonylcarbamoyl transferase component Bud32
MDIGNRYSIIREVAAGGMAQVYLATDTVLGRQVAIKMLHQHLLDNPHSIQRFENEARAIAQLSNENVIKLFDYGKTAGNDRFLVMEFVDGRTISEVLAEYRSFPNLVLLEVMHQILGGLQAAHEKGIYHRDVKPSNIMIDAHGCLKVMDFGIAYLVNQGSITLTGTFVGSPNYISPEQAEGGAVSGKSDVFSTGSLVYECATARCPFAGDNVHATLNAILKYDPVPAFQHNQFLLSEISDLISRCLRKIPAERPSAFEAMAIIDAAVSGLGLSLGKKRIERFFIDPEGYRKEEAKELYDALCARARESSKKRKALQSIRFFTQAERFAPLSAVDRKIIDRIRGGALLRKVAVAGLFVMAIAACGLGLFQIIRSLPAGRHSQKQNAAAPALKNGARAIADPFAIAPQSSDTGRDLKSTAKPVQVSHLAAVLEKSGSQPANPPVSADRKKAADISGNGTMQKSGYLKVRTNPPWSDIYINDMMVGVFPKISLFPVSPGRISLTVKNVHCRDTSEVFSVSVGDTLVRELVLVPRQSNSPDSLVSRSKPR